MADKTTYPGAQPTEGIDVTQSVHARMIFGDLRNTALGEDRIEDATRTKVLRRLFPSITGEALLWFQAHRRRAIMIFDFDGIRLVPKPNVSENFAESCVPDQLRRALAHYNPEREALILMRFENWCELLISDQGEQPTSLGLYMAPL